MPRSTAAATSAEMGSAAHLEWTGGMRLPSWRAEEPSALHHNGWVNAFLGSQQRSGTKAGSLWTKDRRAVHNAEM